MKNLEFSQMENINGGNASSTGCQIAAVALGITVIGAMLFPPAGLAIAFFGASAGLNIAGQIANGCGEIPQ
ncbi:hypothetical protein FHS04_000835 [Mesoflavibacter sabulilitoris]|nr:hypothetical protein [Mesoflavibacter zeaxanthinifaciens]MBB3123338.1 hypothetical protein [Mesoflavibacter zeaxanthinifaciens subsp. sabulilitoris]